MRSLATNASMMAVDQKAIIFQERKRNVDWECSHVKSSMDVSLYFNPRAILQNIFIVWAVGYAIYVTERR